MNIHFKMKDRVIKQVLLGVGNSGRMRMNGEGKGG
jgi:hypothetical protein